MPWLITSYLVLKSFYSKKPVIKVKDGEDGEVTETVVDLDKEYDVKDVFKIARDA